MAAVHSDIKHYFFPQARTWFGSQSWLETQLWNILLGLRTVIIAIIFYIKKNMKTHSNTSKKLLKFDKPLKLSKKTILTQLKIELRIYIEKIKLIELWVW